MTYADVDQTERTAYTNGANTTSFLNSPLGLDKSTTGSALSYVIRDNDGSPIGFKDSAGTHWYYLVDGLGSVVAVITAAGTTPVGNRYGYDEFGQSTYSCTALCTTPVVGQPLGYAGGILDPTAWSSSAPATTTRPWGVGRNTMRSEVRSPTRRR
jgi:hypothetical protein